MSGAATPNAPSSSGSWPSSRSAARSSSSRSFVSSSCPRARRSPPTPPAYLRFVDQFQRLCAITPDIRPWRFAEAYSPEASEARFRSDIPEDERRRISEDTRARAEAEASKIERMKQDLGHAAGAGPMVQLFERYGLTDSARIVFELQKHAVVSYLDSVGEKAING